MSNIHTFPGPQVAANDDEASRRALGMTQYPALHIPTLTAAEVAVLKQWTPAALWMGGNLDGPQPVRSGDNRGRWPVRFGAQSVSK